MAGEYFCGWDSWLLMGERIGGAVGRVDLSIGGRCVGGMNSGASGDSLDGDGYSLSGVGAGAAMLGDGLEVAGGEW